MEWFYAIAADGVFLLHLGIVWFVILGLVLTILGGALQWSWVRNAWFRATHLVLIGVVVAQAWVGVVCPLTTWEMALRERAGQQTYDGSFIAHWLGRLLWVELPPWGFLLMYTLFGAAVVATLVFVPPRWPRRRYAAGA